MPLYITENGSAFFDPPKALNGRVIDPVRMHYLNQHLCAVRTAIEKGVDVRGYMAWSLMDNYEWSHGYAKRFGIVHVDFETLERTPKDTARYYSKIIESNGAVLDETFPASFNAYASWLVLPSEIFTRVLAIQQYCAGLTLM